MSDRLFFWGYAKRLAHTGVIALSVGAIGLCLHRTASSDPSTATLSRTYTCLLEELGNDQLPIWKKEVIGNMLACGDIELVPMLIDRLSDTRIYDGAAIRPGHMVGSGTYACTVGEECEAILRRVISGGKTLDYPVDDWREWWKSNCEKNLGQIVEMVKSDGRPLR